MKINLYREQFKTENYDIKQLSLYDEAELLVIASEFRQLWLTKKDENGVDLFQIDTKKVAEMMKRNEIQELIDRSVNLLNNIIDDTERMKKLDCLGFNDFFFIIPTLSTEIYVYLSELKKK